VAGMPDIYVCITIGFVLTDSQNIVCSRLYRVYLDYFYFFLSIFLCLLSKKKERKKEQEREKEKINE
jgi:Sec-independent protein secretion pathway component TatC